MTGDYRDYLRMKSLAPAKVERTKKKKGDLVLSHAGVQIVKGNGR